MCPTFIQPFTIGLLPQKDYCIRYNQLIVKDQHWPIIKKIITGLTLLSPLIIYQSLHFFSRLTAILRRNNRFLVRPSKLNDVSKSIENAGYCKLGCASVGINNSSKLIIGVPILVGFLYSQTDLEFFHTHTQTYKHKHNLHVCVCMRVYKKIPS